jgi:DNA repair protein RecN (Recombination protein N)
MQILRDMGQQLVDICGQQAHQALLRRQIQRQVLDQHGGHAELAAAVAAAHGEWQAAENERETLASAQQEREVQLELLNYQVAELEALALAPGEPEALDKAHQKAANATRIIEDASQILGRIYEDEHSSAQSSISQARLQLDALSSLDEGLKPIAGLLDQAEIHVIEAADGLRNYLSRLDASPGELEEIEARLSAIHDLARKHRVAANGLPGLLDQLRGEVEQLQQSDIHLESLAAETRTLELRFRELAADLSEARKVAATTLENEVNANIQQLGMADGRFVVSLDPPEGQQTRPGPTGNDRIEFHVALNPGHPPGALSKVASGGELSRVNLAVQVAAANADMTDTHIFDEVDAGVGGSVAENVGSRLRDLAAHSQVLCVTHLPQVASQGHHHLRINKLSDGNSTQTTIRSLSAAERIEELARMLGGVEITDRTRAHAAEMLTAADRRTTD